MVKCMQIILKNETGKYVTFRETRSGGKLCVEDAQNSEVNNLALWVYKEEKIGRNTWAFVWNDANIYYSPKVNGNKLELERFYTICATTHLSSSHWFVMNNPQYGEFYGLASVDKPEKHLSVSNNIYLQISPDDTKWVQVKDESHGQDFAPTC